jgi:two-component system chemotaxis response regulator CheY
MKRILIVDDAATVRMYHRGILESAGYATWKRRGTASKRWKRPCGALRSLLVDVNMPKLNGYGFLRELRQQEIPQAAGHHGLHRSRRHDETASVPAGANGYLVKPVSPAQLLTHVRLMLGEAIQ